MNFIFLSPQFPSNYWNFCAQLKADGVNVLGIGDTPYDNLTHHLKSVLTEYYRVDDMEDYEQVLRAVGYFTFKYGKIDWLESNNEYWLEQDARLRSDFNITSGFKLDEISKVKSKFLMKEYYKKAGIPCAKCIRMSDLETCKAFIEEVGYPVVVKPEIGVGAQDTFRLNSQEELEEFFDINYREGFVMEQFIHGEICSYDAIINSQGKPLFESGNITPGSIMDIVNNQESVYFYMVKDLAKDVRDAGRLCVKAFGVKSRFIHLEFFRLLEDKEGIGKKGDIAGLEVNMRPSGGFSPDMMNYANSVNVYKIWADMIAYDSWEKEEEYAKYFCVFIGRRDGRQYAHSHNEVLSRYRANITLSNRLPQVLAMAMGNQIYVAKFLEEEDMKEFIAFGLS